MFPFRDNIPARRYPVVTVLIIIANVLAFLYELSLPENRLQSFVFVYGLVPADFSLAPASPAILGSVGSLFTSMFLHGGIIHLLGNMWYLWIFGDNVEDRMGHARFVAFYLICGLVASAAHILWNPASTIPSIGASGAVAGVLGAYLISYPFARILTILPFFIIWPIVELPAILVLGFWFIVQLLNGWAAMAVSTQTTGGVAWFAHIGGFVAGMLLIGLFAKSTYRRYYWD